MNRVPDRIFTSKKKPHLLYFISDKSDLCVNNGKALVDSKMLLTFIGQAYLSLENISLSNILNRYEIREWDPHFKKRCILT